MQNVELFTANLKGRLKPFTVFVDDTQAGLHIWRTMTKEYLGEELTLNTDLNKVFKLIFDDNVPYFARLILASTLDGAVVFRRNLRKFNSALAQWQTHKDWATENLGAQLTTLFSLAKDPEILAVAWNQSTDVKNRWIVKDNGKPRKYNLKKDKQHFDVFKVVKENGRES